MIKINTTTIRVACAGSAQRKAGYTADLRTVESLARKLSIIAKERKLRHFCRTMLEKAQRMKSRQLCFMPYAVEGFPVVGLTRIVTQEIHRFLTRHKTDLQEILIVTPDRPLARIFKKEVVGYLQHLLFDLAGEPYITVDAIIELPQGIVIIERSNPPFGWALPGGFVDRNESLEAAVRREAMEETHLKLSHLRQFHTYSDPKRDPRFHTIDTVFIAKGVGLPRSGDDAKNLKVVPYQDLLKGTYAFDHKEIIKEYLKQKKRVS